LIGDPNKAIYSYALTKSNHKYERIVSTARDKDRMVKIIPNFEDKEKNNRPETVRKLCFPDNKEQFPKITRKPCYSNVSKYYIPQLKPKQITKLIQNSMNKENRLASLKTLDQVDKLSL